MRTAVGAVEAGRDMLARRAARQQREARVRFWRTFAVSLFFIVAVGANLYVGAVVMIGNFGNPFVVDKAPQSSTAQIKRPLLDSTFCRNVVFDNATSHVIEDKVERCDKTAAQPRVRERTLFNWGGR